MQLAESDLGEDYLVLVLAQQQPRWSSELLAALSRALKKKTNQVLVNK